MISLVEGNLLKSKANALVNTVNEVGVMGKGIALMFAESFPTNTRLYQQACKEHKVQVGKMFTTSTDSLVGPKWIINFPTKKHWRNPSQLKWIQEGLIDLVEVIKTLEIDSVAIPPLGCGNGGLEWRTVKRMIEEALNPLQNVKAIVYAPTQHYQNTPKEVAAPKFTPAKALIIAAVSRSSVLGFECSILEVQKLAWFLSRGLRRYKAKDALRLRFAAQQYGPYSDNLRHVLASLEGSFLRSDKRISDASPYDVIDADPSRINEVEMFLAGTEMLPYMDALNWTQEVIEGFESPFGMELLATIDWLVTEQRVTPSVDQVREAIANWPYSPKAAKRKADIFDDRVIGIALTRLSEVDMLDNQVALPMA